MILESKEIKEEQNEIIKSFTHSIVGCSRHDKYRYAIST
jgi:hypothetical protein